MLTYTTRNSELPSVGILPGLNTCLDIYMYVLGARDLFNVRSQCNLRRHHSTCYWHRGTPVTAVGRHQAIPRSVRLSVPWHSYPKRAAALGYRHAGCLQLSHRRPPEMCGLRTRPRTDVDRPPFLDRTAIGGGRHIVSPSPGDTLLYYLRQITRFA